jgi:hypothetical protein
MNSTMLQRVKNYKGFDPQANTGAAISGDIIDRLGYDEAYVVVNYAVVTGSPSAATTSVVVSHGDAANLSDTATFVTCASALDVMTAGLTAYAVDLSAAKRYVRIVWDATYTGGSTPGNVVGATVVLGNKSANPPVADTILGR